MKNFYLYGRRVVQTVVNKTPFLDSSIGVVLRKLEKKYIPVQEMAGISGNGWVDVHGFRLYYRPEDAGVVTPIRLYGDYEPETTQEVMHILKPGMGFLDLGAHIGFFSLLAAKIVGNTGSVFAFEPMKSTRGALQKNIQENGLDSSIEVVPFAIADTRKTLRFSIHPEASDSAKMALETDSENDIVEVEATDLDSFFKERSWPRIDLVKMDVEGCETDAFLGMSELNRRNPSLKVIFEFNAGNFHAFNLSESALFDALAQLGFSQFTCLYRKPKRIKLPEDIPSLIRLAKNVNFNILAEKL